MDVSSAVVCATESVRLLGSLTLTPLAPIAGSPENCVADSAPMCRHIVGQIKSETESVCTPPSVKAIEVIFVPALNAALNASRF